MLAACSSLLCGITPSLSRVRVIWYSFLMSYLPAALSASQTSSFVCRHHPPEVLVEIIINLPEYSSCCSGLCVVEMSFDALSFIHLVRLAEWSSLAFPIATTRDRLLGSALGLAEICQSLDLTPRVFLWVPSLTLCAEVMHGRYSWLSVRLVELGCLCTLRR